MAKKKEMDSTPIEKESEVQGGSQEAVETVMVDVTVHPVPAEQEDLPLEGTFKRQVIKQGVYRLSAGEIDGMNSTDEDWVIELIVHGRKVYILSEVAYEKSL